MLLITSNFQFWKSAKAGMLMKTNWLAMKSQNIIDK